MRIVLSSVLVCFSIFNCAVTHAAVAIEVTKTMKVYASPDTVWQKIGGFCAIKKWHPIIESCAQAADGKTIKRVMKIAGGSTLSERLYQRSSYTYSTQIKDGPLPVTNYRSTLRVEEVEGEQSVSKVTWTGTFDANGASNEDARKVIEAIYLSGLIQIRRLVNGTR